MMIEKLKLSDKNVVSGKFTEIALGQMWFKINEISEVINNSPLEKFCQDCADKPAEQTECQQFGKGCWELEQLRKNVEPFNNALKEAVKYRSALEAVKTHLEITLGKEAAKLSTAWNIAQSALEGDK
jgi:hypothetical protein